MKQKLHEKIVNYILENYEGIRNENAIRTWCYRILINESMTFLKRKAKEKPLDDDGGMEIIVA